MEMQREMFVGRGLQRGGKPVFTRLFEKQLGVARDENFGEGVDQGIVRQCVHLIALAPGQIGTEDDGQVRRGHEVRRGVIRHLKRDGGDRMGTVRVVSVPS